MATSNKPRAGRPVSEPLDVGKLREQLEMLKGLGVKKAEFYGAYLTGVEFRDPEPPAPPISDAERPTQPPFIDDVDAAAQRLILRQSRAQ
jgi:hypothetical protein